MLDFFLLSVGCWGGWRTLEVRRLKSDFLCASVLDRRSVARREAVTSGEGGSPKMKNLMKTASRRTTDSCPKMRPWVKENLRKEKHPSCQQSPVISSNQNLPRGIHCPD